MNEQPIHIAREGRSLGIFAPEDVVQGMREGRFRKEDLAWRDPMPDWVPLGEFPGLPEPLDSGDIPAADETVAPPGLPTEPIWERPDRGGLFSALSRTVTDVLARPGRVFTALPDGGSLWRALTFSVLLATLTGWVAFGYQYAAARVNPDSLGEPLAELVEGRLEILFFIMAAVLPVANVISSFLFPALFQLGLKVLVNRPLPFIQTFRVYCYAWGAASVFQLLPICGAYAYLGYAIYLTVVGLRSVHRVPPLAASLSVILPILLCCGVAGVLTVVGAS